MTKVICRAGATLRLVTLISAGFASLTLTSGIAKAGVIYGFSFSNTVGTVPGIVTGLITLPDTCVGSAALDVKLTSFPSGVNSIVGAAPLDLSSIFTRTTADSFTVTGGAITSADFHGDAYPTNIYIELGLGTSNNSLTLGNFTTYVYNTDGLNGVTFTQVVPEPASCLTLLLGICSMAWIRLRARKEICLKS
jgi:hypothetical protein